VSKLLTVAVLSVLFSAPALAQSGTKAKAGPKAAAPPGSSREDGVASPAGVATVGLPPGVEEDRALLRAILFVYEPAPVEIRVMAVEDLALLGDARALNVLGALILDTNPQIQLAATRAIRAFQTPRAEEILENIIRHPRTSDAVKLYAIQSLPLQRSTTAREFLIQVMQSEDRFGAQVAQAARNALTRAGEPLPKGQPAATPGTSGVSPPGPVPPDSGSLP